MLKSYLISLLFACSSLGSLLTMIVSNRKYLYRSHQVGTITAAVCLLISFFLYWRFDPTQANLQFIENYLWIKPWNIEYAVGVDGLSLSFILLTVLITSIAILVSWNIQHVQSGQYLSQLLMMQTLMIGSFAATNALFFYICWEAVLIPILLNIGTWGGKTRGYASIKLFLYTFIGSVGFLIALLYLAHQGITPNFNIENLYGTTLSKAQQTLLFLAFFVAFTIKIPLWPLHTWLPDAHTEAPTEGSMILSALMLKLGAYGLLRFCLPILPDTSHSLSFFVCILSVVSMIYAGFVTLAQTDMKRLVAYSSVAHMGIVVLGIFLIFLHEPGTPQSADFALLALEGAVIQMIAHAFGSAGLFLSIGLLYKRFNTREINNYQGIALRMPILAITTFIFILSTIGLPGTAGFVGEFLIIVSAVKANFWIGCFAATTLLFSATYGLWFYSRVFFGSPIDTADVLPLNVLEKSALLFLSFMILLLGIYPLPLVNLISKALNNLLQLSLQTKL